jgi:hypothetical protein
MCKRFLLRGELEEALARATRCIRVKVASQARNLNKHSFNKNFTMQLINTIRDFKS